MTHYVLVLILTLYARQGTSVAGAIHELDAYSTMQDCQVALTEIQKLKIDGLTLVCVPKKHLW